MRIIEIKLQCDWADCEAVGFEGTEDVIEKTVAVDGKKARAFSICREHLDEFEEMLFPLLQKGIAVENGTKPVTRKKREPAESPTPDVASGSIACLEPDCGRVFTKRVGAAQHMVKTHGYASLNDYETAHGLV